MNEIFSFALLCFTSFLTLVNPLGLMPVFMGMTSGLDSAERAVVARKALIAAFIAMVFFAFTGQLIFNFFGISINGLRIVGGFIFFKMGYEMLQAKNSKIKVTQSEMEGSNEEDDISITPLAIPMICGPGVITNSIVLMEDAHEVGLKVALVLVMLLISVLTLVILLSAGKILRVLGSTGNKVLMRLMGLIIMVIAVEFFASGIGPILQNILRGV
ncbi:MarC family protein [Nafulsella turpanensis]|uniref:MarC family protein n=1 Tax=Nafulsella turpanensis TaxID=1265690 RepID=UPI000346FD33|nr:MarC family protein [Nafulsella turpanensis]